jgi:hypothetical protein
MAQQHEEAEVPWQVLWDRADAETGDRLLIGSVEVLKRDLYDGADGEEREKVPSLS